MKDRQLGTQGLSTSAIGYGSMGISRAYSPGPGDRARGVRAIRRAHELGVTLFDTAELYGWGENEKVLGEATASFRDDIVIGTKFGFVPPAFEVDSSPDHIRGVVDNSLRFLRTDHIDILYQHRQDPAVPVEEVAGAVKDLIDAGKVKYFGLCEAGEHTIRAAHAVQPVSVLQSEYSIFERDVEGLFPLLSELGIGLVACSPLGRGLLTGKAKPAGAYGEGDVRNRYPQWQPDNFERNVDTVARLSGVAESLGVTTAQLALAWLLAQGDNIVPVPGSRSLTRVEENIGSTDVNLSPSDLARVVQIVPDGASGDRYPESARPVWH